MGTTAQKLNKILETKEAIRTAINNKGGTLTTTDTFASYPTAIDNLPSGGGGSLKTLLDATKSTYNLFYNYSGTNVNDLISYSDTSNVNNMYNMFSYCSNLTTAPQLDTSSATDMSGMFSYCEKLIKIDISHMANNNSYFAGYCYSLTKLIIRNMDTIPTLNSNSFARCFHFTGQYNAKNNPNASRDGRIYVPDDKVDALKTASDWKKYADIIVPLSTLVE